MNIRINGQKFDLASLSNKPATAKNAANLHQALQLFLSDSQQQTSYAVALNGDFIGKSDYQQTSLNVNDSIDVLFPIQGG